jgi:hypothetical protein
MMANQAQSV